MWLSNFFFGQASMSLFRVFASKSANSASGSVSSEEMRQRFAHLTFKPDPPVVVNDEDLSKQITFEPEEAAVEEHEEEYNENIGETVDIVDMDEFLGATEVSQDEKNKVPSKKRDY